MTNVSNKGDTINFISFVIKPINQRLANCKRKTPAGIANEKPIECENEILVVA